MNFLRGLGKSLLLFICSFLVALAFGSFAPKLASIILVTGILSSANTFITEIRGSKEDTNKDNVDQVEEIEDNEEVLERMYVENSIKQAPLEEVVLDKNEIPWELQEDESSDDNGET